MNGSSNGTTAPLSVVVEAKTTVADGVCLLRLRAPDRASLPAWELGAHIDLTVTPHLTRQYSLCGDPGDLSAYEVAVLREPLGRGGSQYVHDKLAVGDTVHVAGPRNNFALTPAPSYLFIAGGIGITPILPMIDSARAIGARWRLVYGGRSRASMAFLDRLGELDRSGELERQQEHGGPIELRPQDETGLLDLPTILGSPDDETLVYACGPAPLLDAVTEHHRLWPDGSLHIERFVPLEHGTPVRSESFEVELTLSGVTVDVPPSASILQAVTDAGVSVLSSCREGTCGTCETPVLAGTVEHRDSLLTPEEQAANDTMMICVSRAACPKLTLEL